ncbi:MAG: YigZ family protein [Saprospiraceae bacterium]
MQPYPIKYKTLSEPVHGLITEKGSKFIAYALPVMDIVAVKKEIETIKEEHPKARHWCSAYRLGYEGETSHADDDGEPSGTAGRPILGQIDSYGLTNTLIVVVRYFGGVLLGTSGLIRAYKSSAREALEQALILEKDIEIRYRIVTLPESMYKILKIVKNRNYTTSDLVMDENCSLEVALPVVDLLSFFTELSQKIELIDRPINPERPDIRDCFITRLPAR